MAQNFIEYGKKLAAFLSLQNGEKSYEYRMNPNQKIPKKHFFDNLEHSFKTAHLFHVDDETKKLLMLSEPPNKNDTMILPFPSMFIDVAFTKEELSKLTGRKFTVDIQGVVLSEGQLVNAQTEEVVGRGMRMSVCVHDGEGIYFESYSENFDLDEEYKTFSVNNDTENIHKNVKKFIHLFCVNLLNIINDPEIIMIQRGEDKAQNEKRSSRGKFPIPASTVIRLDAERKRYVNSELSQGHYEFGYAFRVRKHKRKLTSERFVNKHGQTVIIPSHTRNEGKGIIIEKDYVVKA